MFIKKILIFLLIILFFLIFLVTKNIIRYYFRNKYYQDLEYDSQSLQKVLENAKSGDLILFCYAPGSYRYSFWYDLFVKFNHVGVVVTDKKTKKKYLVENLSPCKILNNITVEDIVISDLHDRLYYHNYNFGQDKLYYCPNHFLHKENEKRCELFLQNLSIYRENMKFKYYFLNDILLRWSIFHDFGIIHKKHDNSYNCAEFASFCLEKLGFISKNVEWRHYSVMDVLYLKNECNQRLFANPYKINF
jgi:hypothetical protein